MVSFKKLVILTVLFSSQFALALQCKSLFESRSSVVTNEHVLKFSENYSSHEPAKMSLNPIQLGKNPQAESIEIIRYALQNRSFVISEKNFLTKDEIVLGYPLKNDYSVEVVYKSDSRGEDKFIINELHLITPTGQKRLIGEKIFHHDRFELKTSQFDLSEYFGPGVQLDLNVPFKIEGQTLNALDKHASSLKLFSKQELRNLYFNNSPAKIASKTFLRRAKTIFIKVLVKEPFKMLVGGALTFSVFTFYNTVDIAKVTPKAPQTETVKMLKPKTEFVETVTHADGRTVKYKAIATEDAKKNRIDYEVQVVP